MASSTPVHGHEVLRLLATFPDGCEVDVLHRLVAERFGTKPVFVNCHDTQFDLNALLEFFAARDKIKVTGTLIRLGGAPPCDD